MGNMKDFQNFRKAPNGLLAILKNIEEAGDTVSQNEQLQAIAEYFSKRGLPVANTPDLLLEQVKGYIGNEFGTKMLDNFGGYIDDFWKNIDDNLNNGYAYRLIVNPFESFAENILGSEPVMQGAVGAEYMNKRTNMKKAASNSLEEAVAEQIISDHLEHLPLEKATKDFFKKFCTKNRKDLGIAQFYLSKTIEDVSHYVSAHKDEFKEYVTELGQQTWDKAEPFEWYMGMASHTSQLEKAYSNEVNKGASA